MHGPPNRDAMACGDRLWQRQDGQEESVMSGRNRIANCGATWRLRKKLPNLLFRETGIDS